jgi:secreted trypsin-like serine protease
MNFKFISTARIVGGQNAALGQFPYQISIRTAASGSHFCGGFVISNRFMGTAAHCTQLPRNAGNIVSVPHFS